MQQHPQTPLQKQHHNSSFHSLLNLPSLSPLRTLLTRAPSPSTRSSSPTSTRTPIPRIPQIHPSEYSTYKSITKILSTFTSRSIAKARRAKAHLPDPTTDTYRTIHCGDQNCCFSSPYSFYRTRSSSRSSLRTPARSRSISNPNLRLASRKTVEDSASLSPPPPSSTAASPHPFRRSRMIARTGGVRRANSLFEGSPPPKGKLLTPLYKYPEPIGPRSSSWLSGEQGVELGLESVKSVSWAGDAGVVPVRVSQSAGRVCRPSGLSMFSWTAASGDLEGGGGEEREREREIAYEWDGAFGWTRACRECGRERCVKCGGVVFEQIVEEGGVVTAVQGMFGICTPCVHGFCPGTKMWLRIRCGQCGEVDCEGCEQVRGSEGQV